MGVADTYLELAAFGDGCRAERAGWVWRPVGEQQMPQAAMGKLLASWRRSQVAELHGVPAPVRCSTPPTGTTWRREGKEDGGSGRGGAVACCGGGAAAAPPLSSVSLERCGSPLGSKGKDPQWTYFFVGRTFTLMVTKSRSGPAGHWAEPDHVHL